MGDKLREVVITGLWAKSPVGNNPKEMIDNICTGITGVRKVSRYVETHLEYYPIGSLEEITDNFEEDNVYEWTHKQSIEAIHNALTDSGLNMISNELSDRTGLAVGSSTLKVLKMEEYVKRERDNKGRIPLLLMGDGYLQNIASKFNIRGEIHNVSTACSSSAGAICTAMDAIVAGDQDLFVVVSADSLVELSLSGFSSLQSLSREVSTPFDVNRKGINLGEASVAVILEEKSHALCRGAKIYGELAGYGQSNDGYSLTAPDPDGKGAQRVMQEALDCAGINIEEVGYINAHGTGTKLNDSMEIKAITNLGFTGFASSTKGYTGHCLATAGLLELVLSIESCRQKKLIPNYGLVEAEAGKKVLVTKEDDFTLIENRDYFLSNSFGFGGNSCSILVKVNR